MPTAIAPRSTVEDVAEGIEVRIAASKLAVWEALVTFPLWTLFLIASAWYWGHRGGSGIEFPWPLALLWFLGAAFAAYLLLWGLTGCEWVTIRDERIIIRRGFGRLTWRRRSYPLSECWGLRALGMSSSRRAWDGNYALGISGGSISFVFQRWPVRFGLALEKQDAEAVVSVLEPQFNRHTTSA